MEQTIEMETNFRPHQTHFKWSIKDWDKVYQESGGIRSRDFTLKGLGAKVNFTFYVQSEELDVLLKHNQPLLLPNVNAYVLEVENKKVSMLKSRYDADEDEENKCRYTFSLMQCIKIKKSHIVNNTLTIYCDIKYYELINKEKNLSDIPLEESITASKEESVQEKETVFTDNSKSRDIDLIKSGNQPHGKYSFNEYVKFFKESKLCDVAFVFELEEVKAHKAILVRKSPFFRYRLTEKRANESEDFRIDCTGNENISPSILRCFLEYIYGIKKFDDLRRSIGLMKIYILAKEYKMKELEIASEFYMTRDFV